MGKTCNSMADSCQCMTKPTTMLWSDWPPTCKKKKKKENILPNLKKIKKFKKDKICCSVLFLLACFLRRSWNNSCLCFSINKVPPTASFKNFFFVFDFLEFEHDVYCV